MSTIDLSVLQPVSWVAAAIGVCVAAIYYVMTLRAQQTNMKSTLDTRKLQFLTNVYTQVFNEEGYRRFGEVMNMEWTDYEDFERKWGSDNNMDAYVKRAALWTSFDQFGMIVREGIVGIETVYNMNTFGIALAWAKFKDVVGEQRVRYNGANMYENWENLAVELVKIKKVKDPGYRLPETFLRYVPIDNAGTQ